MPENWRLQSTCNKHCCIIYLKSIAWVFGTCKVETKIVQLLLSSNVCVSLFMHR